LYTYLANTDGKDHTNTTTFYKYDNILNINFMNIQAFMKLFRTIRGFAKNINNNSYEYFNNNKPEVHNQWMISDFPNDHLTRKIHESNKRN